MPAIHGLSLMGCTAPPTGGSSYVGPGDIVASATAWYGLRAYSAAVAATGTQKAVNVRRASDNATQDILILTSGALNIASANTFATVDATATASATASTTLNLTGASSTPHVGSTITGTGVVQPCYIISVGSFTAGAGTVVVNAAQTLAAASISMQYALFVTKWYDQTGNIHDQAQATAANQPQLLPVGPSNLNSLPVVNFVGSVPQYLTKGSFTTIVQPYSYSAIAWLGNQAPNSRLVTGEGSATEGLNYGTGTNGTFAFAPSNTAATVTVFTAHALQAILNGASSALWIDGSQTTGSSGTNATGTTLSIGAASNAGFAGTFQIGEVGLWPSNIANNIRANQSAYWGTP